MLMMDSECSLPHALEVHPLGENGEAEVLPVSSDILSSTYLPCGIPPILPDTHAILNSYLTDVEKLPIFHVDAVQRFVSCEPDIHSLYEVEPCPLQTELTVRRNVATGKLLGFVEQAKESVGGTTKTSTSLSRAPGKPEYGVKGSTSSFPFWPGGMEEPWVDLLNQQPLDTNLFDCDYLSTPPGFKHGMNFERKYPKMEEVKLEKISLADVFATDHLIDLEPFEEGETKEEDEVDLTNVKEVKEDEEKRIENELIHIENLPVLKISETVEQEETSRLKCKWAVVENVLAPIDDFHEKIPNMAFKWDFELDIFQKVAILHLEKQECVFVAAHTSAGKTVVAEYAVALAKKHMTRVLYTSPIKALSNQKFREFKNSFEDVGLVTGDVVINPTAFCLIMTTEILRSMLYHGSDVVREVEWVIFDEVHYINDAERGVVWEEVFIMLPQHVNLIMLSATVPNTVEFAEWLGGIKRRKIYVISTLKRPIPLVHHLYTGSVGKTQDDNFAVVDAEGNFSSAMYNKAIESKKSKETKNKPGPYQRGPRHNVTPAQEKNVYIGLLGYLQKKNLLPVICFTLSRKKCNDHAQLLKSQDLTTAKEKSEINHFFRKSISKLKKDDRELRQVKTMEEQLAQGFGVHHSGVLPILKEVVEMLFQRGLVKVLFATETFAMGVNMPARTVVFDSIQKHDGREFRILQPSEFIQMAGRAGRRGLDKTGTVIILCKGDVPDVISLQSMMLGKPKKLESQFKLTYSMILNLLKVKTLKVEDVMKRSFCESGIEQQREKCRLQLQDATNKLSKLQKPDCSLCSSDLEPYCKAREELERIQGDVMEKVCAQALATKVLTVGRILSFCSASHPNIPGILLNVDKDSKCKVLTVASKGSGDCTMNAWTKNLFCPDGGIPEVLNISLRNVQMISNKVLKIDSDMIMKEWRKMEAMHCNPGHAISSAFQDLVSFVQAANQNGLTEAKISFKDMALMEDYSRYRRLRDNLEDFKCLKCPQFLDHFVALSEIFKIQKEIEKCRFEMSVESLKLHSEYLNRKKVLENLGYIDDKDEVQMKGSVAREMSNHELLITELIIRNVFSDCSPEEVAALLSCMVHQQKPKKELKELGLLPRLLSKIQTIQGVISDIDREQKYNGVIDPTFCLQYNFELTQVVYEWSKGVSFATIIENEAVETEEGIIVRCIQRLSELLKDVRNAAVIVGDPILKKKMEDASTLIKRDIVFAASLYIQ